MDTFIPHQNIKRYKKLLERITDESQRQVLLNLLSDEKTKLAKDGHPEER
jgi:rubrerythrin